MGPIFVAVKVAAELAGIWVALGTVVHHMIDFVITLPVYRAVRPMLPSLLPSSSS